MPESHLILAAKCLFGHFIPYLFFIHLVTLILCLFLFHDCFIFIHLFPDNDKRQKLTIQDDKREMIRGQIQYQHQVGYLPYKLIHIVVA